MNGSALMRSSQKIIVRVTHLSKSYRLQPVLNDLSFSLESGKRIALVGPSGCGKTTLLNCLGGIDRADSGSIEVNGLQLEHLSSEELTKMRRECIGTIFQFFHLLPTLSVFENIEFPLQLLGIKQAERKDRVMELLNRVGLRHQLKALPTELSGGEMQRVAIARAIVHRPSLLLADEPTGNLDSLNGAKVLELIAELSDEYNITMLMVTHSHEAARICHQIFEMRDGIMLARIFHADRDEEAAKPDGARQANILTQGCMSTYCPSQNVSLTQHPSGFPDSAVDQHEISGLEKKEER